MRWTLKRMLFYLIFGYVCTINNYESNELCRAVRAMNETLKQNRLLREQGEDDRSGLQKNVRFFIAVTEAHLHEIKICQCSEYAIMISPW